MSKDHKQKKQKATDDASKELYMACREIRLSVGTLLSNAELLLSMSLESDLIDKVSVQEAKKAFELLKVAEIALINLGVKASFT